MKNIQFPVDETHSPILIYDENTLDIIEANPPARELYGYSEQEILSMNIQDLVPDDQQAELEQYQNQEEKELRHTSVWRNKTKNGDIIYVRIQANFVNYEGRECRFAIIHDVTERIKSQERYRIEHELMESLLNKIPGIYVLLDEDRRIVRWNQKLEQMSDIFSDRIEQTDFIKLVEEEEQKKLIDAFDRARTGSDKALETLFKDEEGHEIPVFLNFTRVEARDAGLIQAVGLDISQLKQVEQNLRQANKEKETMLSEIHHRVKNNLAVISGMIEMQVMEEDKDSKVRKKLEDAKLRIKSIAMIHELLYQSESFTQIDFSENLRQLANVVSQTLQADAEVSIEWDLEKVILNVNEALPLTNIANELITNAYKHAFTEQNEGTITLRLYEEDNKVVMEVIDNGKGLPAEFDPENTMSLGFSIVNSLVDQLDADFETFNDNGSHFRITIVKSETATGSASAVTEEEMSQMD